MKKLIALLLAAAMLLTMTACGGSAEPVETAPATEAPTIAPTEEPTETPTQPRELTEEEKKQLHYEQMFSDGTYVMDWSCVNIDINTDYRVEQYSDENGIFWEEIRTLEGDPHYLYSNYYRGNEKQFYAVKFTDWTKGGNYYVADSAPKAETVVDSTVNDMRNMTENFLSRQKSLTYEERENEDTIIKIDCGNLDILIVYVDPITSIVNKAYLINYDKVYTIEFVNITPEDITTFDNLPFTITETVNYDYIKTTQEEIVTEIKFHDCPDWEPTRPDESIVKIQLNENEQAKWEEIFANNAYTLNWDSVKIEMGSAYVVEVLSDEYGIYWEAVSTADKDPHPSYAYLYRPDNTNNVYYVEEMYQGQSSCLAVEVSSPNNGTYAYSKVNGVQWLYDQILAQQKGITYKGTLDGAVVIEVHCGAIKSLVFHIDPSSCDVRKLYIVHDSEIDNVYYVEFIPDTAPRKTFVLPPAASETISLNEAFNRAGAISVEIAIHDDCFRTWFKEERLRGIEGAE